MDHEGLGNGKHADECPHRKTDGNLEWPAALDAGEIKRAGRGRHGQNEGSDTNVTRKAR